VSREEARSVSEVWRRLRPSVDTAASLHARAEGLLDALGPDTPPTIAWSQAQPRALVLGRAAGEPPVHLQAAPAAGLDVVRRRSGGGPVLWDFAFALALGIVMGTYSSWFVAAPIVYEWRTRFAARGKPDK